MSTRQAKRGQTATAAYAPTVTLADRAPWTGGWWAQDETGAMWGMTLRAGHWTALYRPDVVDRITAQIAAWAPDNYAATVGRGFFSWDRIVSDAARGQLVRESAA